MPPVDPPLVDDYRWLNEGASKAPLVLKSSFKNHYPTKPESCGVPGTATRNQSRAMMEAQPMNMRFMRAQFSSDETVRCRPKLCRRKRLFKQIKP